MYTMQHPDLRLRTWTIPAHLAGGRMVSAKTETAWDLPVYNDPYDDVRTTVQPGLLRGGGPHGDMTHIFVGRTQDGSPLSIGNAGRYYWPSHIAPLGATQAHTIFARHSAWYMWRVYEKRRQELGLPASIILTSRASRSDRNVQVIELGPDFNLIAGLCMRWYNLSVQAFKRWDAQELAMSSLRDEFKSAEGIPVYTPDMIRTYDLGERLRDENRSIDELRNVEAQALMTLAQYGGYTSSQILAISRRTATDPIGTRLLETFVGEVVASQDPSLAPLTDAPTVGQQTGGSAPSVITPTAGSALVIDAIGSRLLDQAGMPTPSTQVTRAQVLPIDSIVRVREDLPAGAQYNNVLTQAEEAARVAESATRELPYFDPNLYRLSEIARTRRDRHFANLILWRAIYPKVEILASENPNFDPKLLANTWDGNAFGVVSNGQNVFGYGTREQVSQIPATYRPRMLIDPPLVLVTITPRAKPIPELGFVGTNKWLGAILSVIPVVGTYLSLAWGAAQLIAQMEYANEVNDIITNIRSHASDVEVSKWAMPSSAFEPQYMPQPFPIVLPLDAAQFAVREPWYAPSLNEWFTLEANKRLQV